MQKNEVNIVKDWAASISVAMNYNSHLLTSLSKKDKENSTSRTWNPFW